MGRSFANLHIKSNNLEKTIEAFRELSKAPGEVLGIKEAQENPVVLYISQSNENWISVLHDYFVWGTVKKIGKTLSRLLEEPVMTVGYMNEEIFELSVFADGAIQAEKIFCEQWAREDYGITEERINDDYLREALSIRHEDFDELIKITTPWQAVDKLSELVKMSLWCDAERISYEEDHRRFEKYEL